MTLLPSPISCPTEADFTDSGTATLAGASSSRRLRRAIEPGTQIGRYVIGRRLGAGGMGEVFAAHDGELDRTVALKLIHTRNTVDSDSTLRECERLCNEAQALARLSHPNVVQIYEVGRHDEQTFLAMELVDGPTLGEFEPRSLAELLEVFVQAGRGLAAAHAAGLAHRDFKPSNVIVGHDGRPRVLDFGLAEPARQIVDASTTIGDESDDPRPRTSSTGLGGPGTLPYMAPEQAFSGTGGAAADQFSFCVALFEAIYGARPFAAKGVMGLLVKLESCELVFPSEPPRLGRVPRWLRKLLARGLARHPEDRFASMDALLAELSRDRRRLWRRVAFAASISGVTALAMLALTPAPTQVAEPASPDLAGVWDAEQRAALSEAFASVDSSWARGSEAAVLAGLDTWSGRWIAMAREAHTTRDPLRRRSIDACLASQRAQLESTISALLDGGAVLLEGAVTAIDALPEPSRCTAAANGALAKIDAELAPEVLLPQLVALADAATQRNLGHFELARTSADAILREAQAKRWTNFELAALRQRGLASIDAGDRARGLADLERARDIAVRSQDRQTEAELWVELAWAGRKLDNPALRHDRLALAQAHVDALQTDASDDNRHVQLLGARVQLATALDLLRDPKQLAAAEALLLAGLEQLSTIESDASLLAIDYLHTLARARELAGKLEQAEHDYQRAIRLAEQVRGHGHPSNARVWSDAGALAHQRGELELARTRMTRARDIRRAALRVDHWEVARSEIGLAQLEFSQGNVALAKQYAEQALRLLDGATGDQDPLGETLRMLGQIEASELHWQAAITHYQRALPLTEGLQRTLVELELGKALAAVGQHQRGVELLDAALPMLADVLGPTGCGQLVISYERHADALAAIGEQRRATASLQAALACADDEDTRTRLRTRLP